MKKPSLPVCEYESTNGTYRWRDNNPSDNCIFAVYNEAKKGIRREFDPWSKIKCWPELEGVRSKYDLERVIMAVQLFDDGRGDNEDLRIIKEIGKALGVRVVKRINRK